MSQYKADLEWRALHGGSEQERRRATWDLARANSPGLLPVEPPSWFSAKPSMPGQSPTVAGLTEETTLRFVVNGNQVTPDAFFATISSNRYAASKPLSPGSAMRWQLDDGIRVFSSAERSLYFNPAGVDGQQINRDGKSVGINELTSQERTLLLDAIRAAEADPDSRDPGIRQRLASMRAALDPNNVAHRAGQVPERRAPDQDVVGSGPKAIGRYAHSTLPEQAAATFHDVTYPAVSSPRRPPAQVAHTVPKSSYVRTATLAPTHAEHHGPRAQLPPQQHPHYQTLQR